MEQTFPGAVELERRDSSADAFDNTQIRTTFGTDRPGAEVLQFYDSVARGDGWTDITVSPGSGAELEHGWGKAKVTAIFRVPRLSPEARERLGPQYKTIFQVEVFAQDE